MRKLSVSLKESRFVDLINKKFTGEIRKEDKIGNLKVDLRDGDNYLFTFDEVTDMLKDSEWRLPTVSEVRKLKRHKKYFRDGKYIFTKKGTSLTFYPHGYINVLPSGKTEQGEDNLFYGWTADVAINDYMRMYVMDPDEFPVDAFPIMNKNSLLSVRLVKDK